MSNEAVATPSASRPGGLVAAVDRFFPLLWIGIYLLLPVSGWATEMFESWADQRRDLMALESLLADGRAAAIASDGIGPAYLAAAALFHEVFRLSPEDSLVALTRVSFALSVAGGLLLVRLLVTRIAQAPSIVSITSQIAFVGLVFASGAWYWSDVPWSHFFAAFLAVAFYVARFALSRPTVVSAVLVGGALGLLAATRSFELLALLLAWGMAAGLLAALRLTRPTLSAARLAAGVIAFGVTTAVVYAATGKRDFFFLYEHALDEQSGSVSATEVAQTPTLSLVDVPVKLVQLFVDPCFYSLCSTSDYEAGGGAGTNLDFWSLPLAVQLPALVFLPLCVIGVAAVAIRAARRRAAWLSRAREVRLLGEMTIAATGLVLGYTASTLTGPSHLRYGFARDFLLAALLAAIVTVALTNSVLWRALARREGTRPSPEIVFVVATVVCLAVVVSVATYGRSGGLPRLESRHLAEIGYVARCEGQQCTVAVDARTPAGGSISIPERSTLTFECSDGGPALTLYVTDLSAVHVPPACAGPRLVAAWPTVMGLPPGSGELRAVRVSNA